MSKTHLRVGFRNSPACGRGGHFPTLTHNVNDVDCGRCLVTEAYATAYVTPAAHANGNGNGQSLATTPAGEEQAAIAVVLDTLFESAWSICDRRGYCSTFEDIISEIEVPSWYEVPARPQTFEIEVVYDYQNGIKAVDVDAAYALIAADPRKYISL